jgi:hypothetical protein
MEWCHRNDQDMVAQLRERGYDLVGNPDDLVSVVDESAPPLGDVTDADVAQTAVQALAALVESNHDHLVKKRGLASVGPLASVTAQADDIASS